jgi:hypothetical protein
MDERFSRSSRILGEQKMEKLNKSSVIVFGIGGVGGAALEALVRGGVGTVSVVEWFQYPNFKEKKNYVYKVRQREGIWQIYDYTVTNLGTE